MLFLPANPKKTHPASWYGPLPGDICDNEISYKDLQDKCNGKQRCNVEMTYNPCTQKVLKYSKIVYTCTGNSQYHKI